MIALLELISFHLAVFVFAAIASGVYIANVPFAFPYTTALWLCITVVMVALYSASTGAYSKKLWERAGPHGSAIVLLVGHLAPIKAIAYVIDMKRSGSGSGVLFLLPLVWAVLFYLAGIVFSASRLAEFSAKRSESDS